MKNLFLFILLFVSINIFAQTNPNQCKATTQKGTQCKRSAIKGSDYCYQHNNIINKNIIDTFTIYTGPKGGKYQIKNNRKIYLKNK
jgi:hypothetical protein